MKFTESNLFVVALWLDLWPERKRKGIEMKARRSEAERCRGDFTDCQSMPRMSGDESKKGGIANFRSIQAEFLKQFD
jgi:hypothetical protein